jgi:SLT domain-containing protein
MSSASAHPFCAPTGGTQPHARRPKGVEETAQRGWKSNAQEGKSERKYEQTVKMNFRTHLSKRRKKANSFVQNAHALSEWSCGGRKIVERTGSGVKGK